MTNPFQTPFAAVFQTEVILNSKRVAPYALMLLFTAHSILWWGWSAAATYGWATNSDYNIIRNLQGFSFLLGLPIFNAVIMCDPVIRDFRNGIDPLIFSKPVGRASYLLGKFFGNFFVLVCCQSAFTVTSMLLQWVPLSRLVVHPVRIVPYFKHFIFFVAISHLLLAAVYFTLGTITRNSKIVYGVAVAFYPIYISWQVFLLQNLPDRWRVVLDPMMLRSGNLPADKWEDAAYVNQIVVSYTPNMFANRLLMIAVAALCLAIVYFRFSTVERTRETGHFSLLDLSTASERIQYDPETLVAALGSAPASRVATKADVRNVVLPSVDRMNIGAAANLRKLFAATRLELHLLRSERSLIVLVPLAAILSFLSLPFSAGISEVSPSAAFARSSAQGLLVFLLGIVVFYTGEAMHRDRELRVDSILWSGPVSNNVFLISKFLATLILLVALVLLIGLVAMLTQFLRGQTPLQVVPYLVAYSVILVPSLAFMTSACMALNVLLREKYLAFAIIIALSAGLFYLYTQGYNHWSYNPVVYGMWTDSDLHRPTFTLIALRVYCLGITILCFLIAHTFFQRRSDGKQR